MPARDNQGDDRDRRLWQQFAQAAAADSLPAPSEETLAAYRDGRLEASEVERVEAWLARDPAARRVHLDQIDEAAAPARAAIRRAQRLAKAKPRHVWRGWFEPVLAPLRPSPAFAAAGLLAVGLAVFIAYEAGVATKQAEQSYDDKLVAALWSAPLPLSGAPSQDS